MTDKEITKGGVDPPGKGKAILWERNPHTPEIQIGGPAINSPRRRVEQGGKSEKKMIHGKLRAL